MANSSSLDANFSFHLKSSVIFIFLLILLGIFAIGFWFRIA